MGRGVRLFTVVLVGHTPVDGVGFAPVAEVGCLLLDVIFLSPSLATFTED